MKFENSCRQREDQDANDLEEDRDTQSVCDNLHQMRAK